MSDYKCGKRVVLGDGSKRISAGMIDKTTAIIISDDGPGTPGLTLPYGVPVTSGSEIVALIFTDPRALDALITQATLARKHFGALVPENGG